MSTTRVCQDFGIFGAVNVGAAWGWVGEIVADEIVICRPQVEHGEILRSIALKINPADTAADPNRLALAFVRYDHDGNAEFLQADGSTWGADYSKPDPALLAAYRLSHTFEWSGLEAEIDFATYGYAIFAFGETGVGKLAVATVSPFRITVDPPYAA